MEIRRTGNFQRGPFQRAGNFRRNFQLGSIPRSRDSPWLMTMLPLPVDLLGREGSQKPRVEEEKERAAFETSSSRCTSTLYRELIHDSRPNPKKRMHAGRFPSRSLPILEPSQGVNTTAFTTYSRDYFPPRGKRLSVQLAFRTLSFDVCSCSRRFMAFTQAARFFGPCTPRHTATLHFRVRRRAERSRRGRPTDS